MGDMTCTLLDTLKYGEKQVQEGKNLYPNAENWETSRQSI